MDPKGKVALITGGARIGQVVAHSLAARGCDLALIYRGSREAAEASAKAAINAGVRAITIRADATDEDQIAAAVKETHRALGRIDILLNMASIYLSTPDPKEADWSNTIDANARSVFLFSTAAAPIMKQSGGARIINFADWLPVSGRPRYRGFVPYYSSKAAIVGLTESLALELAPEMQTVEEVAHDDHTFRLLLRSRGYHFVGGFDFARVCTAEAGCTAGTRFLRQVLRCLPWRRWKG
jgi:NAD(P)-dependent dehydrogenase (short-subunit alcohol dehydrogenase family)